MSLQKKLFLHSPFSEAIDPESERFLLLQFLLEEIFLTRTYTKKTGKKISPFLHTFSADSLFQLTRSTPFDRLREHAGLLPLAFPDLQNEVFIFSRSLANTVAGLYRPGKPTDDFAIRMPRRLRQMFFLLEPFMKACKNEGGFLFYLLSRQKDIAVLSGSDYLPSLLLKFHPEGLSFIENFVSDHFYKRGFSYVIPKVRYLIKQLKKIESKS